MAAVPPPFFGLVAQHSDHHIQFLAPAQRRDIKQNAAACPILMTSVFAPGKEFYWIDGENQANMAANFDENELT